MKPSRRRKVVGGSCSMLELENVELGGQREGGSDKVYFPKI